MSSECNFIRLGGLVHGIVIKTVCLKLFQSDLFGITSILPPVHVSAWRRAQYMLCVNRRFFSKNNVSRH